MSKRLTEVLEGREHNYILPFLWQHGEDEHSIREEMARVHESGIGAVCVEARPHPDFLGPKWWSDMDVIMDEARQRKMQVWLLDDDHFPTGHAAGKVKEAPEELHRMFLGERHVDVIGPAPGASILLNTLLLNGLRPTYSLERFAASKSELVSVVAVRRDAASGALTSDCIDLAGFVRGGTLYWDIPEGYWRVFVASMNKDGGSEAQQNYLNPLVRESVQILIDTVYEAFYKRYKADFGKTFAGFFSDEPGFYNDKTTFDFNSTVGKPAVSLPWSNEMPALLEQALGADYLSSLHLLWHDAGEQTNIVRHAYMNIVSRLYGEHFCGQIGEWCRARGVQYIGHVLEDNNVHARLGSGAGHYFRALWGQDMSGLDVVLWQIVPGFDEVSFRWPGGETDSEFFHYGLAKLGVSLAHIDPKKRGRTMCELYGAYGWAEGLKLMKWLTDHMLVRGVNYYVPHAFSQKKFPDPDCPPHMYAKGKNPQYRYYKHLNQYINRISHLLSGGRHVATAAVVYHAEAEWAGEAMYFHKPVKALMQRQIDSDVVPAEIIVHASDVRDGKLIVHHEEYQTLILPYAEAQPADLLRRLVLYADQGLSIRFVDGMPSRSCEGVDVAYELACLAEHSKIGIVSLEQLAEDLIRDGCYDIQLDRYVPYLRNYHYVHEDLELFMFFNEHPYQSIKANVALPVQGKVYKFDAFLNQLCRLSPVGARGTVELNLEPYQSIVLLHGNALNDYDALTVPTAGQEQIIMQEWTVSTAGAEQYPSFDKRGKWLQLANMSAPEALPGFAGTFRYETEFEWNASSGRAYIDLGEVYETAEVWLNGVPIGVRICPPYHFEVSGAIRSGKNELVVEVTNTLVKEVPDFLSAFTQQEPSGLLGPVRVIKSTDA